MSFVVTENCVRCKYMDCVAVCPADCFHEGESMLVIDPAACIDCGICVPECPAGAIRADTEVGVAGWARMNAKYAAVWPSITRKGAAPSDAAAWDGVSGKLRAAFHVTDPAIA